MNLERLKLFAAVIEHGGFTAAGRHLNVTKSHVSQVIGALEEELGVRLLQRTTRRLMPTDEGKLLFEQIAPHLVALADAPKVLERGRDAIAGELRLTTTVEIGAWLLAPVVARFCAAHPGVSVTVRVASRVVDLVSERFDFAIRAGKIREVGLVARPLTEVEFGLYASPGYLAVRPEHDTLEGDTFISVRPDEVPPARLQAFVGPTRLRIDVDDFAFARAVVLADGGVALLPSVIVQDDVKADRLRRVLPMRSVLFPIYLVYPTSRQMPLRAAAFRDALLASVKSQHT